MGDVDKFQIPLEFSSQLRFSPCKDQRTDDEILTSLDRHVPVTSERNVWAFWHSGLQTMPAWQQLNVCNWARLNGPSWTIRVLDGVPESPNYAPKFISDDVPMPACFRERTMDGEYAGTHAADFVRGACLYAHGGVWADVGHIAFLDWDRIAWKMLMDDSNPYRVFAPNFNGGMVTNFLLMARKNDPFIKRWHEIFCTTWEGKTNYKGVCEHPLLKNLGIDWAKNSLLGPTDTFELQVNPVTLFEYIGQQICWVRMVMIEGSTDPDGDTFNGNKYWRNNVLLIDSHAETLAFEEVTLWAGGQGQADILSTSLYADPDSDEYKLAYRSVWRLLTSSTQKISGSSILKLPMLRSIWKKPENKGKDRAPGTVAELLRYGSVNFEQTRNHPPYLTDIPAPTHTLKKGALEP